MNRSRQFWSMPLAGVLIVVIAGLSGCGFHLRGNADIGLPFASVLLRVDSPALAEQIRSGLQLNGVAVSTGHRDPDARPDVQLVVHSDGFESRVLSVSSVTGKNRESQLAYRIVYSLLRADGRAVITRDRVTLARDYVFDTEAVLGTDAEQALLRTELRRAVVDQLLRRLRTVSIED